MHALAPQPRAHLLIHLIGRVGGDEGAQHRAAVQRDVQQDGGPVREVHTGDVVWFPPGVKHWHGASPTEPMTHVAVQEARDGSTVVWLEPVSDEQYRKGAEPDGS